MRALAVSRRAGCPLGLALTDRSRSVAVELGLEGSLDLHAEVLGLLRRELRELHAELSEMRRGDLLVEMLREHVDLAGLVLRVLGEERDLREHLVRERAAHHEARMAGRATEVHEATAREH